MSFGDDDSVWRRPGSPEPAPPPAGRRQRSSALGAAAVAPPPALAPPSIPSPRLPERRAGPQHHVLALILAVLGGGLGILGAVVQELQAGLFVFLAAGVIEESLKPAGIYILLIKWPFVLRNQLYTAALTAVSGLVFALIEAATYVFLYFPDAGSNFVAYRFSVPLLMHTLASFIFGLGLNRGVIDWANGVAPFPRESKYYFVGAMALHAGFNLFVTILEVGGFIELNTGR